MLANYPIGLRVGLRADVISEYVRHIGHSHFGMVSAAS